MLLSPCLGPGLLASTPNLTPTQYVRQYWGPERGFPTGTVYAICQTPDGYLWIGTERGLVRFDGVSFTLIATQLPSSAALGPVLGLQADDEGSLWVRVLGPNLLRYRDGAFTRAAPDLGWPNGNVSAAARTSDGGLVLCTMGGGVMTYGGGRPQIVAPASALPRSPVISIAESNDAAVWLGTRDAGLFRMNAGSAAVAVPGSEEFKINCLLAQGGSGLWIGTDAGVVRWDGTALTRAGLPSSIAHVQALAMSDDRNGNLWIGTSSHGLLRLDARGVTAFDDRAAGPRRPVTAIFEDREGNIWTGSDAGIERIRGAAFATYSTPEGLPSESIGPIYVDPAGRTWFAPVDGGLFWLESGAVRRVSAAGLDRDVVYSIGGRGDDVWVGRRTGGLTRLRVEGDAVRAETYTHGDGLAQDSVYAVCVARDGAVWAGTLGAGASRLSDKALTTYTTADSLASNTISAVCQSSDGTVWLGTPNGLCAFAGGRWRTYGAEDGLVSQDVCCIFEDSGATLWIGTARGLAYLRDGRVTTPSGLPAALGEPVLGIAEDRAGSLWISTSNHVVRVGRDALLRGRLGEGDVVEYGVVDGLRGTEGVKRQRSVVADAEGRVWITLNRGISVVDPVAVAAHVAPALAAVQGIEADGEPLDMRGSVRVPPSRRRVTFDYAGLSFAAPERVRFRYRLDGFDHEWSPPTAAREAVYTNLTPGTYRFRVIASDSQGLWNGEEAVVDLTIEPAIWQTMWFRLLLAALALGLLFAIYRIRLAYVSSALDRRFEERLAERTRIAQELHDTLLQGVISASMQVQVAADLVPDGASAKPLLDRVAELMRQVIDEGRNAVGGLRGSGANGSREELGSAFARIAQETPDGAETNIRVFVEGRPRALRPMVRDEVYRIGREALVNASRHARATSIVVVLEYAARHLRLVVRDDGCGIDPKVLESGREKHWGLVGMRERAEAIGARLSIRSRLKNGTEVELTLPAHAAYSTQRRAWTLRARERRRREGE